MSDQITHEDGILLAKALAKAQARIIALEDDIEEIRDRSDTYRDWWTEEVAKVKELEEKLSDIQGANMDNPTTNTDL